MPPLRAVERAAAHGPDRETEPRPEMFQPVRLARHFLELPDGFAITRSRAKQVLKQDGADILGWSW